MIMEQIGQVGAFGKFKFNDDEQQALTAMREAFGKYRGDVDSIWPKDVHSSKDNLKIGDAVQVLLPPNVKVEGYGDSQYLQIRDSSQTMIEYQGIPRNTAETTFFVKAGHDLRTWSGKIELLSSKGQIGHYLSFMITEKIRSSLVDDLVNMLGKAITPTLYGIQASHYSIRNKFSNN